MFVTISVAVVRLHEGEKTLISRNKEGKSDREMGPEEQPFYIYIGCNVPPPIESMRLRTFISPTRKG